MNPMNDQEFFDLAMKVIAGQSTEAERAEFESLLASQPSRKAEWERMQAEAGLVKGLLPLVSAVEADKASLPAYARERLQTKVRQTLGRPVEQPRSGWNWRWILGFAAATAVILLMALPRLTQPTKPVVQVAMLDAAGAVRGSQTNEMAVLRDIWKGVAVESFSDPAELAAWEKSMPEGGLPFVKVSYDRTAAEVRVVGLLRGQMFKRSFPAEVDLTETLKRVRQYIQGELGNIR
jgi:hypothetical protein